MSKAPCFAAPKMKIFGQRAQVASAVLTSVGARRGSAQRTRVLTIATRRYFNYKISPVNVGVWQRGMGFREHLL
ncbi:MAG: hypothetical protein EKK41_02360 [Hyphomicrobiales bacterium]|nr:MAG: hypothetical protein EKK41_02360 [Hyphomicrobiales bacterium]